MTQTPGPDTPSNSKATREPPASVPGEPSGNAPVDVEGEAVSARERILDAALPLFAAHGYDATPVRRVAEDAGVATGLVYYHFADKAGLLRAIFERSLVQVEGSLDEASRAASEGSRAGLDRLVRTAFAAVARDMDFWRLSYQLRMQTRVTDTLGDTVAGWSEAIRHRLEELLRAGCHPDPAPASRALFAAVDGAAQHFVLDPDHYPLDPVAVALVDAFAPRAASDPATSRTPEATRPRARSRGTARRRK